MSSKDRLDRLKKQKAAIEARIQAAEARERGNEKKKDTRRKILIGAYYLDKATKDNSVNEIAKLLDRCYVLQT
jgi:hypothetical protein